MSNQISKTKKSPRAIQTSWSRICGSKVSESLAHTSGRELSWIFWGLALLTPRLLRAWRAAPSGPLLLSPLSAPPRIGGGVIALSVTDRLQIKIILRCSQLHFISLSHWHGTDNLLSLSVLQYPHLLKGEVIVCATHGAIVRAKWNANDEDA